MTRAYKVTDMVDAALVAMGEIPDTTASEVTSAALTLALRVVQATVKNSPTERDRLREAVSIIFMECADWQQLN